MKRFHMQKDGLMVEHHYQDTLRSIRKTDRRFRYAHIRSVVQLMPSQVKVGIVYLIGNGPA